MNELCKSVHKLMEDVRKEYCLSQEVMAKMIGVSKKTFIQLEKQRIILKWSEAVTVCTVFKDSAILSNYFNINILDLIQDISFKENKVNMIKRSNMNYNNLRGFSNE